MAYYTLKVSSTHVLYTLVPGMLYLVYLYSVPVVLV